MSQSTSTKCASRRTAFANAVAPLFTFSCVLDFNNDRFHSSNPSERCPVALFLRRR